MKFGSIARRVVRALRAASAAFAFWAGLTWLRWSVGRSRVPPFAAWWMLGKGWGNPSWAAPSAYLAEVTRLALRARAGIVECGSGLSSVVLHSIAAQTGVRCISLEHNAEWLQIAHRRLQSYGIDPSGIVLAPLMNYGAFEWYEVSGAPLPPAIDLVVCDGPPGTTRGGRGGMLDVLRVRLAPGCVVLLDDAHRAEEQVILAEWGKRTGGSLTTAANGRFAALRLPDADAGKHHNTRISS